MSKFPNKIPVFRKSTKSLTNFDSLLIPFHYIKEKYDLQLTPLENPTISSLFLTKRLIDQKEVLLKQVIISETSIFQNLKESLEAFNAVNHPNVERYLDVYFSEIQNKNEITFITEKYELSLYEMITSLEQSQPKPEEELLQIFSDVAFALYHCHSKNISHNHIDPYNVILIHGEERPKNAQNFHVSLKKNIYKLRDWKYNHVINIETMIKSSKTKSFERKFNHLKPFAAPESFNSKIFNEEENKAMDVYSLGMCILNFCGISLKRIQPISISVQEIHDYQLDKIFHEFVMKSYNWHIVEILKGMLKFNVNERWNIDQVWISLKSLKNMSDLINGRSMESEEKASSDLTKSGILKRFLKKFGTSQHEKKDRENSQNSDNDSVNQRFSYKISTKNISVNLVSKEDYKSLLNVKPMKNYKYNFFYFCFIYFVYN